METPCYSARVDEALRFTARVFRCKRRKGTAVPYLSHLLHVSAWVAEHGGNEDQMVAALLHDYLEDVQGATSDELEARFGTTVARMVEALSDSQTHPKPPWQQRKQDFLRRLRSEPETVKLIAACDKLHNALSLKRDLRVVGEEMWERFTASKADTLWYYRGVLMALAVGWDHPVLEDLRATVQDLHLAAAVPWDDAET